MPRTCWTFALLVLALLAPVIDSFAAGGHGCEGHVCRCASHCAPKRNAASKPCHGGEDAGAAPDCAMRGSCQHDAPALLITPVYLLPQVARLTRLPRVTVLRPAPVSHASPGFRRIEPQPPKAC